MAKIGFGAIHDFGEDKDINENPITARIVPEESNGSLTLPLYIPFNLRAVIRNVQENENVFYAIKSDGTGIILGIVPDYLNEVFDDWDFIIRNDKVPLQINGNVHIKGNVTIDSDLMVAGNNLVEGNIDVLGNLSADGDSYLSKGIEVTSSATTLGNMVKIDGMTATGAKAFNGFPAGSDTFTGAPVSQDTVMASPLGGNKANGNKGNYEKAKDNEERTVE